MPKTMVFSDEVLGTIQRLAYALKDVKPDEYERVVAKALGLLELAVEERENGKTLALVDASRRRFEEIIY